MLERIKRIQPKPVDKRGRFDTNRRIVKHNEFEKFIAPSTLSSQRKTSCHFDQREKSFLDPSHSLGMTGFDPSPWRPLRSLREIPSFPMFSWSEKLKYVWLGVRLGTLNLEPSEEEEGG